MERGDWTGSAPSTRSGRPSACLEEADCESCEHELPGTARHDPLAYLQNRTVDWLDHQLAARELLDIDPGEIYLVVEHEYPPARIQDKDRLAPILAGSVAFTKAIDEAAAAMYALQSEVMAAQGIPVQGVGREAVPVMSRLRAGMVGGGQGGFIGAVHRIAAELDGEAQVVAGAMSSSPARAKASAEAWGLARSYDSYEQMATLEAKRDDGFDFAIVATPNHLHLPVAKGIP